MNLLQRIKDFFTIHVPEHEELWGEDWSPALPMQEKINEEFRKRTSEGSIVSSWVMVNYPDSYQWNGLKGEHEFVCGRCKRRRGFKTHKGLDLHRTRVHKRKK